MVCKTPIRYYVGRTPKLTLSSSSLAILGEASVDANAQITSLSRLSYLPRLVPAPQALIRHDRPDHLRPKENARVVASVSGNKRDRLNHIASVIHNMGTQLPKYAVHALDLTRDEAHNRKLHDISERERKKEEKYKDEQIVSAATWGPLQFLAVLGCVMSIALLVVSIMNSDGMSLLATLSLSLCSSFTGFGSRWRLSMSRRIFDRPVPDSDVIISFPQGAFIVVRCEEAIQRELYWAPEKCTYAVESRSAYRIISLVATILLMAGVIFVANASDLLQLLWAGAYVILNAA